MSRMKRKDWTTGAFALTAEERARLEAYLDTRPEIKKGHFYREAILEKLDREERRHK